MISVGGYVTETHLSFKSHELATQPRLSTGAAERDVPKSYHPPTVEDEEEDTGSDTGSVSVEIEEPESTMRPPPTKPKSLKTNKDKPPNWGETEKKI